MGFTAWIRAIETVGDLVDIRNKFFGGAPSKTTEEPRPAEPGGALSSALGQMETRLAGVLVAALREAFDRDRARLDLEREQIEAERRRADEALRLEARRLEAERAIAERRLTTIAALALWITSAAIALWLPGMRATGPKIALGLGWASLVASIGTSTLLSSRLQVVGSLLVGGFALVALAVVLAL
jgi:hypothetical protein